MLSFSLTAMTAGTRGAFLVVILGLRFVRHQPCCFINVALLHVSLIPFIDTGYILYKRPNYQLKDSLLHEVKELTYKPTWRKNRQWRHTSFYQPRSHEVMPKVQTLAAVVFVRFRKLLRLDQSFRKWNEPYFAKNPSILCILWSTRPKTKTKKSEKKKLKSKVLFGEDGSLWGGTSIRQSEAKEGFKRRGHCYVFTTLCLSHNR